MADLAETARLKAGLARIWQSSLPALQTRLGVLEAFAEALARGDVTAEQSAQAEAEAHKLSGVLGTFGHPDGSTAARELEKGIAAGSLTEADIANCLKTLRQIIRSAPAT